MRQTWHWRFEVALVAVGLGVPHAGRLGQRASDGPGIERVGIDVENDLLGQRTGIAYPASVPGKLIAAWRHGALQVVLSVYILDELRCNGTPGTK